MKIFGKSMGQKDRAIKEIELEITGMTCDNCARHVEQALKQVAGVRKARVPTWREPRAVVSAEQGISESALVDAVVEAGYQASIRQKEAAGDSPGPRQRQLHARAGTDFDLAVIGTGGAGMAAAIRAAEQNARVAIIEKGVIGGTCVNIGCVPSKTLLRAAEIAHQADHHPFAGVKTRLLSIDWPTVRSQKDELVASLRQQKYIDVLQAYGDRLTVMQGTAQLEGNGDIVLDGRRRLRAGKLVIATGARPKVLPLKGIEKVRVLDSTSLMALESLPESMLVIGGRAVALELGQVFARLGTRVTVLQRSERLLPEHEPEVGEGLAGSLRAEGIRVETGTAPQEIREEKGEKIVVLLQNGKRREFRAAEVLMATGRAPNIEQLNLTAAGIETDAGGFIRVDAYLQTTNPNVYAAGDVATLPKFVYVAAAAGGLAATNALAGNMQVLDLSVLPDVIFTDPQVATVGHGEAAAKAAGFDVKVSLLPLEYVPRALASRSTQGFIKLVADRASDRLLGAHVLAPNAGEVIQTAALAIKFGRESGFTVREMAAMLFPYLTAVEGLKLAAQTFEKDLAHLSCCAA